MRGESTKTPSIPGGGAVTINDSKNKKKIDNYNNINISGLFLANLPK